ncbi:hypothetical protein [Pontimicrobium sp. IMCC45349]|uniref:hypothetical protein n=1 Tax=Pontimicrobium sp. IMCC45349 TaxID=3391574 RepID=UPI0039A2DBE7
MKLIKILQYAYVFFAVLFIYDAISNWNVDRNRSYVSLVFAALAVFMFFFRKKYSKRFHDRGKL